MECTCGEEVSRLIVVSLLTHTPSDALGLAQLEWLAASLPVADEPRLKWTIDFFREAAADLRIAAHTPLSHDESRLASAERNIWLGFLAAVKITGTTSPLVYLRPLASVLAAPFLAHYKALEAENTRLVNAPMNALLS